MENVPRMDWSKGNQAETFALFKQRLQLYFNVKNIKADQQAAHLLLLVGEEGLARYNAWNLPPEQKNDLKQIWKRFEEQLEPSENFRVSRLKLMSFRQRGDESLDEFVNRAKHQANKCSFSPAELDERILELIIAGAQDTDYQKALLSKDKGFSLHDAITLGRTYEATASHVKQLQRMQVQDTPKVDALQQTCRNCGGHHKPRTCPAFGTTCKKCGKKNHWAKVCQSKSVIHKHGTQQGPKRGTQQGPKHGTQQRGHHQKSHHMHEMQAMTDEFDTFTFNNVQISSVRSNRDEAFVTVNVKPHSRPGVHNLILKVDTGAQGNTLPLRTYRQMFPDQLTKDGLPKYGVVQPAQQVRLTAYNGTNIKCHGTIDIPCRFKDSRWENTRFFIVDVSGPAVIGLPSCESLKIVTMHCSVHQSETRAPGSPISSVADLQSLYPDQFDRIGCLPGAAKLVVDTSVPPHIDPPRKTPIALKDSIKQELDTMERNGVIRKVTEPTDWVSSLAYSRKKGGELRVCLDPRHLNKALKRPHHRVPTVEELTHKFSGAKVFSKLDAKSGYWSVVLDPDSHLLTTFQSPFGRYCFTRLPFGLSVSQDIFQLKMDQILDQVDGVVGIADDVAVYAKNDDEHNNILCNLMRVSAENGLVFNSDKCHIKCDSITFFGMKYDANGVHPDPEKVADLQRMPTPTNKQELQTFLGFIQFLAPFVPNLSQKSAVLRDLLKKDTPFVWEPHHQASVDTLKETVSNRSTLRYFDTSKMPTLQVDASIKGLGACLLQDNEPIAYASKSLSDPETRYACIERELLAIVFGVQRFHTYLYGRPFHVVTDHKPLVMILQKPLTCAPPRLQRMLLKLQNYNFTIEHLPGKDMAIADTLSRLPNMANQQEIDLDVQVSMVQFSPECTNDIRAGTKADPALTALSDMIVNGWPSNLQDVPPHIRSFWSYRDELSVEDGIVLKGNRVVIPKTLQQRILTQLHYGHQGIEKTRLRARDSVFWENINKDIETLVKSCPICQEHQPAQQHETLHPHEVPTGPWEVIGADLFQLQGNEYLLIADYYSKFFVLRKFGSDTSSNTIIKAMKQVFSEQGVPSAVISDNGPQFASAAFKQFAEQWSFKHVTSSPHYPQSNGFIERQIQTVKAALTKAYQARSDPDLALLCLRATPISAHLPSAMEILNGRKARSNLPEKPIKPSPNNIREELQHRQMVQKMYYDRNAKDLPDLTPGQQVRHQDQSGKWQEATVLEKCDEPRSYLVQTPRGQELRRNRVQLRDVPQPPVLATTPAGNAKTAANTMPAANANPTASTKAPTQDKLRQNTTRSGRLVKPPKKLDL